MMKFNTNQPALASVPVAQPQRKPIVVFCLPGYSFTPGFFDAWTRLLLMSKDLPFEIIVSRHYSPVIFHCRANLLGADNRAGKHQLPFQGRIPYDYIMWLDSDAFLFEFTKEKLNNLLEKNKDYSMLIKPDMP